MVTTRADSIWVLFTGYQWRGAAFAVVAMGLHWVSYLYSGAAYGAVVCTAGVRRRRVAARDDGEARVHVTEPASNGRPRLVVASVQGRDSLSGDRAETLEQLADVRYHATSDTISPEEAADRFQDAEVIAVTPKVSPPIDRVLLEALPRLQGIALHATGFDFIDVDELRRRNIVLSVLPDYSTRAVAEHTIALLLSMSTRLHLANDRSRAMVPSDTSLRGFEVHGRTLGIIGCGRIGRNVAHLAQALGMRTIAYDIDPRPMTGVAFIDRDELLASSDVVSLHCPIAFEAPPMVGRDEFERMRPGALLLNSSRSSLVDDAAVVVAIRSGLIRGYAVDEAVFAGAPVADLLGEGRILQTGHSAWWSNETLIRGARMWADHIEAMLRGRPLGVVDARGLPVAGSRGR